jgi:hypothetical protein
VDEHALVVVKALPKGGEMFVTIPLGVVCIFQHFLCFDVEVTPAIVQMFLDLEGTAVAVRREAMFQLGIVLFIKGVT